MDQTIDELIEKANLVSQNGDWAAAFNYLEQAYHLKKDDAGIITGLGNCALQLQKIDDAFTFFQQAVILAPDSPEAHNNLGVVQQIMGQYEAAEGSFQMATALDPENAQAWKNLASLYLLQDNRVGEGVQILQAVILSNPKDVDALYLMGKCYAEIGDLDSAILMIQTALVNQPDHAFAKAELEALMALKREAAATERIARPEHAQKLAALKGLKPKQDAPDGGKPSEEDKKKLS